MRFRNADALPGRVSANPLRQDGGALAVRADPIYAHGDISISRRTDRRCVLGGGMLVFVRIVSNSA